jgi:hypothetical protein
LGNWLRDQNTGLSPNGNTAKAIGWPMSSRACRTANSCPGIGGDSKMNAPRLDLFAGTRQAVAFTGSVR